MSKPLREEGALREKGAELRARRDAQAARRFFRRAMNTLKVTPTEVVTDAAAAYPAVLDELIPAA